MDGNLKLCMNSLKKVRIIFQDVIRMPMPSLFLGFKYLVFFNIFLTHNAELKSEVLPQMTLQILFRRSPKHEHFLKRVSQVRV